jgi:hypothetical protein
VNFSLKHVLQLLQKLSQPPVEHVDVTLGSKAESSFDIKFPSPKEGWNGKVTPSPTLSPKQHFGWSNLPTQTDHPWSNICIY